MYFLVAQPVHTPDRSLASPYQQGMKMTNGGIFNRWYRNGTYLAFCLLVMIVASVTQSADDDHRYDLDYWIGKLRSDSQEDQHKALFRLHFSGSATLPALSAYEHVIRTSNEENRVSALKIIAQLGPTAQSAVPTVRKALKSSHGKVRRAAAFCVLSVVGEDDEAITVMSELLRNGNSEIRRPPPVIYGSSEFRHAAVFRHWLKRRRMPTTKFAGKPLRRWDESGMFPETCPAAL